MTAGPLARMSWVTSRYDPLRPVLHNQNRLEAEYLPGQFWSNTWLPLIFQAKQGLLPESWLYWLRPFVQLRRQGFQGSLRPFLSCTALTRPWALGFSSVMEITIGKCGDWLRNLDFNGAKSLPASVCIVRIWPEHFLRGTARMNSHQGQGKVPVWQNCIGKN